MSGYRGRGRGNAPFRSRNNGYNNNHSYGGRGRGSGSFRSHYTGYDDDRSYDSWSDEPGNTWNGPDPSLPATFQAWVVGILNGGDESWLKPYVESAFFEEFRARMKKRTGFDAQWLVNGYTLYNTGREYLPSILDYIKDAVTSSVTVESTDTVVYTGLIKFASQQTQASSSSSLTLRGQHEMLTQGQDFHPVSGQPGRIFWFNESLFYLETFDSSNQGYEVDGHWISTSSSDYLLVRCFGGSPKPIHELIEHCKRESVGSEKLEITQMRAGRGKEIVERRKRPLFTIDLEPALRAEIAEDAETFFHKSSRNYYEATGTPYRRGYLLSGPPGTGKTSLSNAIASHVNVPLVTITLSGMDDKELETAFAGLPIPCVVLLEDIDCAGVTRNEPKQVTDGKSKHSSKSISEEEIGKKIQNAVTMAITEAQQQYWSQLQVRTAANEFNSRDAPRAVANATKAVKPPEAPKVLTLSGLLNVIDGVCAKEGRLLIMTTNAPRKLDPALYRAGRADRVFELGYANKVTAELTFKRTFGQDEVRKFTIEAVDRLAKAFRDQFPKNSRISTAKLAEYCNSHRGRPDRAVEAFADFLHKLRTGADAFSYDINDVVADAAEDGDLNVPDEFDRDLLKLSHSDYLEAKKEEMKEVVGQQTKVRSWRDTFGWSSVDLRYDSKAKVTKPKTHRLAFEESKALRKDSTMEGLAGMANSSRGLLESFPALGGSASQAASSKAALETSTDSAKRETEIKKFWETFPFISQPAQDRKTDVFFDVDDEALFPDDEADFLPDISLTDYIPSIVPPRRRTSSSSVESAWDEAHHNAVSPVRSSASVKFSDPGRLRPVSPRPLDTLTLEHEDTLMKEDSPYVETKEDRMSSSASDCENDAASMQDSEEEATSSARSGRRPDDLEEHFLHYGKLPNYRMENALK